MAVDINGDGLIALGGTSSTQGRLRLAEDTDNGTNYIELTAPASVGSDRVITFPDATTTVVGTDTTQTLTNKSIVATQLTGTIAAARLPAGSVLQVVSTSKTSIFSTSHGESWADVTGFSVNITPTSASSKVLVFVTCGTSLTEQDSFAYLRLVRGSTAIAVGDSRGSATDASMDSSQQTAGTTSVWAKHQSLNFLDSPNTASQVTYKIQSWVRSGRTLFVGGTSSTVDSFRSNLPSIITVMEIAG